MMNDSGGNSKDWRQALEQDLREYLVQKIARAMFPIIDENADRDPIIKIFVAYAEKLENEMYKSSNSRDEYYQQIAETIFKIEKELEKKHQNAKESQMQQQEEGSSLEPMLSNNSGTASPELTAAGVALQSHCSDSHTPLPTMVEQQMQGKVQLAQQPVASVEETEEFQAELSVSREDISSLNQNNNVSLNTPGSSNFEFSGGKHFESMNEGEQITNSSANEVIVKQETPPKSVSSADIKQETVWESSQPLKVKPNRKIFKPDELRQALMPTLVNLYKQDPESLLFRQPGNPHHLGIVDYFDIIKMDLATIKRKLDTGQYQDPWQYIDDVNLMFSNAWLYNRKTSRVYKHCTKLAEVFEQDIDPVMLTLGYCCGRKYVFQPQILCCYGKQLCTIPRDTKYWSYQNRYTYCQKCFSDIPGDTVSLEEDPTQAPMVIKKEKFVEMKNNHLDLEPFIECSDCGRKLHQICVLHFKQIWPEGFTCDNCLKNKGKKRKENKFTAKRLQQTKLGQYIENRVNNYLKKRECDAGEVTIRVVSSSEKYSEVKPEMKARFVDNGELPERFPYRAKAIFAFQEIDGVDTCFFGMHVQEYGSDCPPPNARRVYIAYLDNVQFFQPKQLRTAVYHEILLSYLDYAKQLGYTMAHIWTCPPSEGDDYIFHCHHSDQKITKLERLQDWYKKMLDKGKVDGVVLDYKDILRQASEDNLTSAAELPYFDDDFWPNVLEDSIKELEQEDEGKWRAEATAAEEAALVVATVSEVNDSEDDTANGKKKGQTSALNKMADINKNNQKNKKSTYPFAGKDLIAKVISMMEKHKEIFFVIRLQSVKTALPPIVDPDPFIACEMMDGRDTFLTLAREKHYEFSSMRRTKFSTMAMLYQLHNQGQNQFVCICNNCKTNVQTRFHCTVCDDFDLCIKCHNTVGLVHKMQRLGLELGDDSAGGDQKQINPPEPRGLAIQRCIASLEHACECGDAICRLPSCWQMKRLVSHAKACKRKVDGSCAICKQLIALNCYHANNCQETKCPVLFCLIIKQKLEQQRMAQAQILKRRIATMQNCGMTETIKQTSPGSSSNPTNQPSPDTKPLASQHVPQPGIGMKSSACSPVGALQALPQVQAAATRQSVPYMVPAGARLAVPHMVGPDNYGNNTMMNHLTANPALMCGQQQHMQKPMNQMMGMRNMSNWDKSNFQQQNIQPQNPQPGQPIGIRPQTQMMGGHDMPNPARSDPSAVGISQSMSNPGTSASSAMQDK